MTDLDNKNDYEFDESKYTLINKDIKIEERDGKIVEKEYIYLKQKKPRPDYVKRAMQNYINKNKEEFYKKNNERTKEKCAKDPEYHERLKQQKKDWYLRKKEEKLKNKINENEN